MRSSISSTRRSRSPGRTNRTSAARVSSSRGPCGGTAPGAIPSTLSRPIMNSRVLGRFFVLAGGPRRAPPRWAAGADLAAARRDIAAMRYAEAEPLARGRSRRAPKATRSWKRSIVSRGSRSRRPRRNSSIRKSRDWTRRAGGESAAAVELAKIRFALGEYSEASSILETVGSVPQVGRGVLLRGARGRDAQTVRGGEGVSSPR